MASIVNDIVNAVEKAISDFESLIKSAIATLESKASAIANDIKTTSQEIYQGVRAKMTAAIQAFKSRLSTKTFNAGTPGVSSSTFRTRIDNALRDLVNDLQALFDRAKNALKDILNDSRLVVRDIEKKLVTVTKDTTSFIDTSGKDFLRVSGRLEAMPKQHSSKQRQQSHITLIWMQVSLPAMEWKLLKQRHLHFSHLLFLLQLHQVHSFTLVQHMNLQF